MDEPLLQDEPRGHSSSFLLLLLTVILEITGTLSLKYATHTHVFYVFSYSFYIMSLTLFSFVLTDIPLHVAYTTWSSLGIIGVTVASQFLFSEHVSFLKWACILGMILCLIGIHISP